HSSSVNGSISFDNTLFMKGVTFSGAKIGHSAYFSRAVFSTGANFIGAQVAEGSVFEGAVFRGDAAFERATFGKSLWFRERPTEEGVIPGARFVGVANFKATRVGGQAEFSGAVFENEVRMTEARFNEVLFRRTKFVARATREQNEVSFSDAEFGSLDFGGGTERASF